MENKLSKFITGSRKLHGTQHSMVTMLKKRREALDKREYICLLFFDLTKAFDTINHNLLLAKPHVYGGPTNALNLICGCLKTENREYKLTTNLVLQKLLLLGFHKAQYTPPFYLIHSLMTLYSF